MRARIREHMKHKRWAEIAALRENVPTPFGSEWLEAVDEIAFALGQLGSTDEAASLLQQTFAQEPTRRRASALAYLYYAALFASRRPPRRGEERPARNREADRQAFTRWMQEALRLEPDSIKDLYRLGEFEAQVQSRRDAAALRAFQRAIAAYRALPPEVRARRHDLFKPYVRSLYAAARSAFRLGRLVEARQLAFSCIREDEQSHHVQPMFKLLLAGKICAAQGQLEHAERAFRLALDAPGPRDRDYVYGALADLARRQGRLEDAEAWIQRHVPAHRRSASLWRILGDVRRERGQPEQALHAYQNALQRDRSGRHLTLVRIGDLHREAGRPREAARAYEQGRTFRRRRYLSDDPGALQGLLALAEAQGDAARANELRKALAAVRPAPSFEVDEG